MPWSRESRHARGYGTAWDKLRLRALKRDNYLCQPCLRIGRITPASAVDHIIPKMKQGSDELSNLQSICGPCHTAKTTVENGGQVRIKATIGLDGYPV